MIIENVLDVNLFLKEIYINNEARGLDLIMSVFHELEINGRYDMMNEIINRVDLNKLESIHIIAFFVSSFKHEEKLKEFHLFLPKAKERLLKLGKSKEKAEELLTVRS